MIPCDLCFNVFSTNSFARESDQLHKLTLFVLASAASHSDVSPITNDRIAAINIKTDNVAAHKNKCLTIHIYIYICIV